MRRRASRISTSVRTTASVEQARMMAVDMGSPFGQLVTKVVDGNDSRRFDATRRAAVALLRCEAGNRRANAKRQHSTEHAGYLADI
jgi:hypothetical protein